jgi:hypothetical protein
LDRRRLDKIDRQLQSIQASPYGVRASDLVSLAVKLGRNKVNRGKEPTYERGVLIPGSVAFPLTIPGHAGDLKVGTVKSIVNALQNDVDEHRQLLDQHDSDVREEGDDDPA